MSKESGEFASSTSAMLGHNIANPLWAPPYRSSSCREATHRSDVAALS